MVRVEEEERRGRMSFPSDIGRWLGKDCSFYDDKIENNCHYSLFVRRICKEDCCPDLGQYSDDAEVMTDRLLHAASLGEKGHWEDRDPTRE